MSSHPPVVDAHNDLLLELDHHRGEDDPFGSRWLSQLRRGGVALQVCPCFAAAPDWVADAPRRVARQLDALERAIAGHPEEVVAVSEAADLADVRRGRLGLLAALEGVEALGTDPGAFDVLWERGVRLVSLTHNARNPFADGLGVDDDRGLTGLGRELVTRLDELGAVLDLAHASPRTFDEALATSRGAIVVTHVACRALHDSPRNLSDDQLRAVAARGGMIGIMALPFAVGGAPSIERVADHVEHAVDVVGVEHVGLGADFFAQVASSVPGFGDAPGGWAVEGLAGPAGYPALLDELIRRGHDTPAIAGENFLSFFTRVLPG